MSTALVPLKFLAEINRRDLPESTDPSFEFHYLDIGCVGRGRLVAEPSVVRFDEAPTRARRLVANGDTIVSTVRTYLRAVWPVVEANNLVVSTGFAVLSPRPALDPKFLGWWAQADPFIEEIVARSTGVSYPAINPSEVGDISLPLWPLPRQRAIADYLGAETARIDGLIAKKRQMIQLLGERWHRFLADCLVPEGGLRLKHLLKAPLAYGVLVPDHAGPEGVPMLRIMDLAKGHPDLDSVARISATLSNEYRRTVVRTSDLVVSVVGTLGRTIEITASLEGCNLNRPLARVQLQNDVPRSLIRFWFESDPFRTQALAATSSDSAQPTLGLGDLKNFVVGLPLDRRRWQTLASELDGYRSLIERGIDRLSRQIDLLMEHRQALITAAVTGELELPGAAA